MNERRPDRPTLSASPSASVVAFLDDARRGCALPLPGNGHTPERLLRLRQQAALDPSVGRLFEAHADALAILAEAGVAPPSAAALAVWASGRTGATALSESGDSFVLNGMRAFCGGASLVDAALMITDSPDGERLVLIDLRQPGVRVDSGTWKTDAFRDAGIGTVSFTDARVEHEGLIGRPGWYGSRDGFWHGAVGVAAIWAGIADSILCSLPRLRRYKDELSHLASGSIQAAMWAVSALLDQAGQQIDRLGRSGSTHASKSIALSCRHSIRSLLESALVSFDQEVGPAATAFDTALGQRRAELALALAQGHGPRDLVVLSHHEDT